MVGIEEFFDYREYVFGGYADFAGLGVLFSCHKYVSFYIFLSMPDIPGQHPILK